MVERKTNAPRHHITGVRGGNERVRAGIGAQPPLFKGGQGRVACAPVNHCCAGVVFPSRPGSMMLGDVYGYFFAKPLNPALHGV